MSEKLEKPTTINILGIPYQVLYVDKPSDVDIFHRKSLSGQIDYWTRTIRIHDANQPIEDLWSIIFHEVLHGIAIELRLKSLENDEDEDETHKDLDILALALTDVLVRNGWLQI